MPKIEPDRGNVVELGNHPVTGEPVRLEMDPCRLAMAQLKEAGIPLYEVDALQAAAQDQRAQAQNLREKAQELDQKAKEFEGLLIMCGRRDIELASKGMRLKNGRVVLIDGDNL